MTRKMPLWGVVLSLALGWGSLAYGQQQTPVSAANDSLSTTGEEAAPATGGASPSAMTADTTTAVRRVRHGEDRMMYYISLGVGSSYNYLPESFKDSYSPAFGLRLGGGISRYNLNLGINFSYNFFFSNGPTTLYPDDLNILTVFGEIKFVPAGKTVRPYILACGGFYRQWIVNAEYTENVLGYGAGAGIELVIDRVRHLYLEGRYIQGQTRETEKQANTESIPMSLGVVWVF
jgi:hypothetical protein